MEGSLRSTQMEPSPWPELPPTSRHNPSRPRCPPITYRTRPQQPCHSPTEASPLPILTRSRQPPQAPREKGRHPSLSLFTSREMAGASALSLKRLGSLPPPAADSRKARLGASRELPASAESRFGRHARERHRTRYRARTSSPEFHPDASPPN